MLPLSLPSMADLATLLFAWVDNDNLWLPVLSQDDRLKPATVGLAQGRHRAEWSALFAVTSGAVIPTVLVVLFLQRSFARGLTMGSSKYVVRVVRRLKCPEVGWCASG